jgi:hypothetical protein
MFQSLTEPERQAGSLSYIVSVSWNVDQSGVVPRWNGAGGFEMRASIEVLDRLALTLATATVPALLAYVQGRPNYRDPLDR